MFIPSTLETVRAQHPTEFDAAVLAFRRSDSKRHGEPLVSFSWGYEYAVQVPALSFEDVMSGAAEKSLNVFKALPLEARVRDYEQRVSVRIVAKLGNRIAFDSEPLGKVPRVILDEYRKRQRIEEAAGERFAQLSPEEQLREVDQALEHIERSGLSVIQFARPAKDAK